MGKGASTREPFIDVEGPFSIDPSAIWGGNEHLACAPNTTARGRFTDTGQSVEASHRITGIARELLDCGVTDCLIPHHLLTPLCDQLSPVGAQLGALLELGIKLSTRF